ncbi:Gfo/Idh/MocA family protein [Candidatus Cetobacterium colombiensis]|uniref:Gfo/Idh/MocA family oxidoreductase n=1 Tax=Candidatus Cetobacterium colombiensis TaxID=3073100 RepID=A0ABU4W955_9FUSO|nr:Gfo/Idh/MocA family oxidoreductase [Candidatus Cetobacterium colombiensis]MDX8335033.1 Gfo/Idh/MocA family oxidoreductase [Candidatus Cetobacterium colombiensis]
MINIAIVGTSKISQDFAQAIEKVEGCKLLVIYSRNYEKGLEFGKNYNIKDIVTDFEILCKREDIDMVYLASPNSIHFKQTIELLKNKKHVLCEKPMGINVQEIEEMYKVAYENNVTLMEAMKNTFLPNFKSIQENLYKIGEIRGFIGNFCQYSSRYDNLKNGELTNIFDPNFGGGSHLDLGVYPLYFALRLFGMPQNTKIFNYTLSSGVPGMGSVILEYKNMISSIIFSKITNSYIGSEIQGENGSILIDSISNLENIKIYYRNGEIENITVPQEQNSMIYELKAFLDLIKNKKVESDINTKEISKKVIEILTKK